MALGAEFRLSEAWELNVGIAYDSSMTSDETRSLPLALASQLRFGLGAQVAVDRHWSISMASEIIFDGSPIVDVDRGPLSGHVSGTYANASILMFGLGFTWKS